MNQEDSNGSSFEIIDKKSIENINVDRSDSLSNISSPYSISSASSANVLSGNILSNVAPPSSIPDFTLWTSPGSQAKMITESIPTESKTVENVISSGESMNPLIVNQFPATQFSAAIPPSKGIPQEATQTRNSQPPEAEVMGSTSIMGLVKGALANPVFSKMAEKARNSVDSLITTLDPQMSEYIYSGGDLRITVTTTDEEIVGAIREAVHSVLGKAWVNGINLHLPGEKSQAVGFEQGMKKAEETVEYSYKFRRTPTVAVENILFQQNESWFDVSLLILKDFETGITLRTFSQTTPVPLTKFIPQIDVDQSIPEKSIESKLAEYLINVPGWQEEVSGVSRKEVLLLSAKTLMKLYKDTLSKSK